MLDKVMEVRQMIENLYGVEIAIRDNGDYVTLDNITIEIVLRVIDNYIKNENWNRDFP